MLYPTIFSIFSQILCILEKKQIQWVDKCNIHRINRPLIQDLEWNVQCEMFAILYSCTLRGRGNAGEGATGWKQDPWVGRDWQLGWLGLGMAAFHKKVSPVSASVRIMQHVARIMYRMCINILISTGLLSYAWNTLCVIHAWFCLLVCLCWLRPLLRFRIDGDSRREDNSAGAVPSLDTVLLLVFIPRATGIFLQILSFLSVLLT